MKKRKVAFILLFIILVNLYFVIAQINTEELEEGVGEVKETAEEIKEFTGKEKWEFIADKWKEFLLKNTLFAFADSVLEKISFIFFIFIAQSYDFSPLFFMNVFIWLFHFWIFSGFMFSYMPLKRYVGAVISLGILVVLSHLRYINFLSELMLNTILYRDAFWYRIVIPIILFVLFLIIALGAKKLRKSIEAGHEEVEKLKEKYHRKSLEEMAEAMRGEDKGFMGLGKYIKK